jgi:hypothetical protein
MFDDPYTPIWKPFYIQVVRLRWMGRTLQEIATETGLSPATVHRVVHSDKGRQILASLEASTFDSLLETQAMFQAAAPQAARMLIDTALNSPNESARNRAAERILGLAGHTPLQRVSFERPDPLLDKYKGKTEIDIMKELRALVGESTPPTPDGETNGPDGKPLN